MARPVHLVTRFFGSLRPGGPRAVDREWAEAQLLPDELELWRRMSGPDRRHSAGVARRVQRALGDEATRPVLAAALLHDVGKLDAHLRTYGRVVATLAGGVVGHDEATIRHWTLTTGFTRRVGLYLLHPELGADLLGVAGSDPLTVAWAREHHLPPDAVDHRSGDRRGPQRGRRRLIRPPPRPPPASGEWHQSRREPVYPRRCRGCLRHRVAPPLIMITLQNVTKTYKNSTVALRDASVEIAKGEFVFLVGASGSGKSTFIRLLNKEESPEAGHIYVAGKDIGELSSWKVPFLRRNIGCVFQDFKLLPTKTVFENVAFALEVIGRPRSVVQTQVPAILDLVGLGHKAANFPDELSGGEQQRVSIARAFVNRPLILLADEPTGNLDPATSVGIMRLLDRINKTGTTVVMATHDRGIVDTMRRRVIELDRGSIVRDQARGVYE